MKIRLLVFLFALVVSLFWSPLRAQSDINLTGYAQTFDDEFNTLSVTSTSPKGASTWYFWPPYGAAGGYSESTWDTAAFSVAGGILSDKAFLDSSNNWHSGNLSSMDPTKAGFSQQYGYFEIRCQMPSSGTGAWPAFWLNGTASIGNTQQNEEIDIFEWYGTTFTNNQSTIQEASHNWNTDGSQNQTQPFLYSPGTPMPGGAFPWQAYHIYGCQVDPVHITWYIDGVQTNQIATPTSYLTTPFYVMVDYALGGGWPLTGMVNNSSLNVDWVRVYSLPAAPMISSATTASGTVGSAFSYQITATNSPTSFNATGLPAGLSVNTSTGAITGTPTASGTSAVTLSATNASGTGTATLTLTVNGASSSIVSIKVGISTAPQLQATDVAGAPGYAAANWNDFTGANQSTSSLLKDGSGSTSAGVTLSSFASATATQIDSGTTLTPDQKLYAGIIQAYYAGSPAITVSAIPYSSYDVVVYLASDSAGRTGSVSLSGSSTTYYYSTIGGGSQPTAYTKVTSTTSGTYTTGNYVVFANQSGASKTISLTPSNWSGIAGIQIVNHATAPAAPVSINLTGPNTAQQLQAGDTAGAPGYAFANWNVFTGANQSTSSLLKDSTGSTSAGVTLSSFASATETLIDSGSGLTPNQKLFAGIIQAYYAGLPAVTLSSIPYAHYNVVVYVESDSAGRTGSVSLSGSSTTYYYSTVGGGSQPATYTQVTSTTSGTYTSGNYVVFTNQSGASKTISLTPSNWSGICGIQIVPQ